MREESVLAVTPLPEDDATEVTLRPQTLDDFVGQAKLKERLLISLDAARTLGHIARPRAALRSARTRQDHAGFDHRQRDGLATSGSPPGPPSKGPATSPRSSPTSMKETSSSSTRSTGCPAPVEEVLYPAMEDFQLDIVLGKGPSAQSIRLDLPRFTLVAATTRKGKVAAPLPRPLRHRRQAGLLRTR